MLPAPLATPAAQPPPRPYYEPTKRDAEMVTIVQITGRAVFVTGPESCSLLRVPQPERIH